MKLTMDLVLILLLIVLMYYQPTILTSLTSSVLGRIVAVGAIAYIAILYGRNAALIGALIFILLSHNHREGLENKSPKGKKKAKKPAVKKAGAFKKVSEEFKKVSEVPNAPAPVKKNKVEGSPKKEQDPNHADAVNERIKTIVNGQKKKPLKTKTNKVDLEDNLHRSSYVNSQDARGDNGGGPQGLVKKQEKQ